MLWDICMDVYIGDCSVRECFCHLSVLSFMFLPACQISSDESKKKKELWISTWEADWDLENLRIFLQKWRKETINPYLEEVEE